ncbi:MAG: hypothetical protein B7Z35_05795 [Hydrogenophilales bacterium 12-61-10]|nr:MAG: hypothetical protein B7Z35_05795 [Hydrogenophilales bacterium 12-61-10]OYX29342.1 MAG: hypothetical protein B7Z03_09200 [Hydrogenophilales bacterium 32-62-9]
MIEKLAEAINALHRIPTQLLLVAGLAAGFILFIPEFLATTLAVDGFRKEYRVFLGPGLVLVAAWLLARLFIAATGHLRERENLRKLMEQLNDLTSQEKGYLATFIVAGNTTIYVAMDDGIIGGLRARNIVYRSSNIFTQLNGIPYNLQPWAREHLSENPQLLEGAEGRPQTPREKLRTSW